MDDKKIIELFFERSERALTEIKLKYDRLCMKIASNIVERTEDAEECVASSYFKLWNAIPPKRPESLRGYLCKIVRNTAIDCDRKARLAHIERDEPLNDLEEVIPSARSLEQDYDVSQITRYLNEFLKGSEKKSRELFVMRYYFNMSMKEAASQVGLSENAAALRLSRMRAGLKAYLTERGVEI